MTDIVKSVSFNDSESSVISITNDSLRVVVPKMASGSYLVKIKTKTENIDSTLQFRVLPIIDLPILSGFFPKEGRIGTQVTLKGSGFNADKNLRVYFGDSLATIVSASNDSICVLIPTMPAGKVKIKIHIGYDELSFAEDFLVLPKPVFYFTNKVAVTIKSLPIFSRYESTTSDATPPGHYTIDTGSYNKEINFPLSWNILYLSTTNENNTYHMKFGNNRIPYENWIDLEFDEEHKKIRNLSLQLADDMYYDTDYPEIKIMYDIWSIGIKEADYVETDSSVVISSEGTSLLENLNSLNYTYYKEYTTMLRSEKTTITFKYLYNATSNSSIKIEMLK
jgi:hypothetical protein